MRNAMNQVKRQRVISIDVSVLAYQQALEEITLLAKHRMPSYACFANAHMTIEAHQSHEFQRYVNSATYVFADGMPLVFGLKWLYGTRQERIAGMDLMADVLRVSDTEALSVFLYGSTPGALESLRQSISKNYPRAKLVGSISPPFRELSEDEFAEHRELINDSGAHIVLVGLGCPKQETWMAKNTININACLLGVGGAFGLYAGLAKRAPLWMRNMGLEWLYRFAQEPKRLFYRYATTNSRFLYLFAKQLFSTRLF